jgi:SHS family lactate transporter-like MFS transporter
MLLTFLGPENRGRSMRVFDDDDIIDVKGHHHAVMEGNLEEVPTHSDARPKHAVELVEQV